MMRACGYSRRILAMASTPLRTGMRKSIKVTSGSNWRNNSIPCCPLIPSAITSMSETVLMSATKPCRTTAWSSTTITLILSGLIYRHINDHFSTQSALTVDGQRATDLSGALAHAYQAKVAVALFHPRLKATAVITNTHLNLAGLEFQVDRNLLGPRVFHDIADRFLPNPQQVGFDRRRQTPEDAADIHLRLH